MEPRLGRDPRREQIPEVGKVDDVHGQTLPQSQRLPRVLEQGLVETFALRAALLVSGDGRGGHVAKPRGVDHAFPQGLESRCLSYP